MRAAVAALAVSAALAAGCSTGGSLGTGDPRVVAVAVTTTAWGSIVTQLGGTHAQTTSIISNPNADPHDYEPTVADARSIAAAQLVVQNGVGYDSWAGRTVHAEPAKDRVVIDVGRLVDVDDDGNPHLWYSPADVEALADAVTTALAHIDPDDAGYFMAQRKHFDAHGLAAYHQVIADIREHYSGVPVGASESVFAPMADALGLDVVTPTSFLKAISEGGEPSTADKATVDAQIRERRIKVYVVNSQNSTPDIGAQVDAARRANIPVTTVTETLTPIGATFQQWQVTQLESLREALRQAVGR